MWVSDGIVDEIPVKSLDQFTGIHDKNGAKIFDGDVVRFDVRPSFEDFSQPVKNATGKVNIGKTVTSFGCWDACYCNNILLIGSIHQNPDIIVK